MKHTQSFEDFLNEAMKVSQDLAKELVEIAASCTNVDLTSEMNIAATIGTNDALLDFYIGLTQTVKDESQQRDFARFQKESTSFLKKYNVKM